MFRAKRYKPRLYADRVRQLWHLENKSHWIRAVDFAEDRSQVRQGQLPHMGATLRKAELGLLWAHGFECIAKARRRFAARPDEALVLVNITMWE